MHFCFDAVQDGTLRIFEWPSMKTLLDESKAHSSVKNLTFRSAFFIPYQNKENFAISRNHFVKKKCFFFVLQRKW